MEKLFCDCKTDAEKSAFFLSGRAVETGVIASAISNDVAMAYHRCDEFKKENDELRAKIETAESDAAHQKALTASALRVAEGWERKCGELRVELETERMRLVACGVVALANTPDSAKQAREMRPEYWSASCGDVARMVDENIKLRARIEEMERREPVAWLHESRRDSDVVTNAVKHVWGKAAVGSMAAYSIPLYTLPGAKGE